MGAGASVEVPAHLSEEHQTLLNQGLSEDEVNKIIGLVAQDFEKIKAAQPELSDHQVNEILKEKFKNFQHHYGIAPGMYVRNDSEIDIIFQLSRETPLHWMKIGPGEVYHVKCGRVFFDVSADAWTEGCEPTAAGVAAEAAGFAVAIAADVIVSGLVPFAGLAVLGGAVTMESMAMKHAQLAKKSAKISEVPADGRIAVVTGAVVDQLDLDNNPYQAYALTITLFNEHGHLTSLDGTHPGAQYKTGLDTYKATFTANDGEEKVVMADEAGV